MLYNNDSDMISARVLEHNKFLESKGYEVVCTMLQGSQNYGLDEYSKEYKSDVDTKSIILPNFDDIVNAAEPISIVEVMDNEEHAEVKDIRVMGNMFFKMNISYIELLYSKCIVVNPKYEKNVYKLLKMRDQIAAYNPQRFVKCLAGMALEKQKALCHPYPVTKEKIEKYGYDGKQLSHAVRLLEFLTRYVADEPVAACYQSKQPLLLMNYKKQLDECGNPLSKDDAVKICDETVDEILKMRDEFIKDKKETKDVIVEEEFRKWKAEIIKQRLKEEILDE